MVVTEQDEREQLEEAEVEVVPTECELEILVVDVVNEILEVLSLFVKHQPCDGSGNLLLTPIRHESRLPRRVREVALVVPVASEFRAKLGLLVPVVSGLVQLVEDLAKCLESPSRCRSPFRYQPSAVGKTPFAAS